MPHIRPRLVVAFLLVSAFFSARAVAEISCAPDAGSSHFVARVIDGDTLVLDDGREVRLIGALAPRPDLSLGSDELSESGSEADTGKDGGSPQGWPPANASRRALEALVGGQQVTLHFSGRKVDRYNRVLAQLSVKQADRVAWVQQQMILSGQARAYALPGDAACLLALLQAEAEARRAKRGLWSEERFPIYDAADLGRLSRLTGRFAIVQGTVRAAARTKETTYLNFGDSWRQDFTASLPTAVVERGGVEVADRIGKLAGRTIRVRGWIERRNGPMIVLSTVDEIEILDGADARDPDLGADRGDLIETPEISKTPGKGD